LLQYDIFVRGGLAAGPTHHSKDFVFGTAVTEAYELESTSKAGPLVLLSSEVVEEVERLGPAFKQWLREENPGKFFIHYLMRYAEYTSASRVGDVVLTYPAQRIAYFVGQRLKKDEGSVLEKAKWFQDYWNDSVAGRGILPRIDVDSQQTLPAASLTIVKRRMVEPHL
jgi:hypothetical protein